MQTINIHAARTQLSRLVDEAAAGEEIIIARAGKPVAKLVALGKVAPAGKRVLGRLAGKLTVPADFGAPLPDEVLELVRRALMRLLLDTHILLWALDDTGRLDSTTRQHLQNRANEVLFSAASIWEIAIKTALGRPISEFPRGGRAGRNRHRFPGTANQCRRRCARADLPPHHRDPFDRLLVAQAMTEPARLYAADRLLPHYSELVQLAG